MPEVKPPRVYRPSEEGNVCFEIVRAPLQEECDLVCTYDGDVVVRVQVHPRTEGDCQVGQVLGSRRVHIEAGVRHGAPPWNVRRLVHHGIGYSSGDLCDSIRVVPLSCSQAETLVSGKLFVTDVLFKNMRCVRRHLFAGLGPRG